MSKHSDQDVAFSGGSHPSLARHLESGASVEFDAESLSAAEAADGARPDVGAGSPLTAEWEEPAVSWLRRQPLVATLIVLLAPTIAALIAQVEQGGSPAVTILLAGVAAAIPVAVGWARRAVTPVARPRDDAGMPLAPAPPAARVTPSSSFSISVTPNVTGGFGDEGRADSSTT